MKNLVYLLLFFTFFSCNKNIIKYEVSSENMIPNIYPGDYIHVDTSIKDFTYGDIIVHRYPGDDSTYSYYDDLYRIVGLPNDSFSVENDICIINGIKNPNKMIGKDGFDNKIEEVFPNGITCIIYSFRLKYSNDDLAPIKIPEGHYFISGDTRTGAPGSRIFGAVPKEQIIGKIVKIVSMHE